MRKNLPAVIAACLVFASSGVSLAQDDARALIDKAIKAHGGEANLAKFKAGQSKAKGTADAEGMPVEFTQESYFQHPDKRRDVVELNVADQKLTAILVRNGDQLWYTVDGRSLDLDERGRASKREDLHLTPIMSLPLLTEKIYELSALDERQVNGRPALGVKVSSKGHRDVKLWFDKESGLLVKDERQTVDEQSGQDVLRETIFTEYAENAGVRVWKKALVYADGKKAMEVELLEIKPVERPDERQFEKP